MSYTLIKGSFHIHYPINPLNGPEPDGDTIKFQPDNRQLIENLPRANRPPKFTLTGITTLRFEGIDALETHFSIEGDEFHQKMDLALAARDRLLRQAGFGAVSFFAHEPFKVESVENHPISGYILSNGLDTFGRAIAFAYTGDHPAIDGSRIFAEPHMLDGSLNADLLREGQAYPAFYITLPAELREHLKAITSAARAARTGLWAEDTGTPTRDANVPGVNQLQQLVIWPKLFRRLAAFFQDGHDDLAGFDSWLRADPRDRDDRLILPNLELGNLHDLFVVTGNNIRLVHLPEDIVIVPDDFRLPEPPEEPTTILHAGSGSIRIVGALINPQGSREIGKETVTILNTTNADINLANWFIADRNGQQPLDGILASGEARRVQLSASVQLSNRRDTITILDPGQQIVDQVSYEPRDLPKEGFTMVL